MDRFSLTFALRQDGLLINTFVIIHTTQGDFRAQYVPCSETPIQSLDCFWWRYDFCVQRCDLPGGLEVCNITPEIIIPPYLTAIPPFYFDSSDTVLWSGAGTFSSPFIPSLIISADAGQSLVVVPDGVYVPPVGGVVPPNLEAWALTLGGEGVDIIVQNDVVIFPMPFACEIQDVWVEFNTAPTGSTADCDIRFVQTFAGSVVGAGSIFTTPLTIDDGAISSINASIPMVLDPTQIARAEGDQMAFDWTQIGSVDPGEGAKLVFSLLRV